jgi:hypothetical protein
LGVLWIRLSQMTASSGALLNMAKNLKKNSVFLGWLGDYKLLKKCSAKKIRLYRVKRMNDFFNCGRKPKWYILR